MMAIINQGDKFQLSSVQNIKKSSFSYYWEHKKKVEHQIFVSFEKFDVVQALL
jgi:cell division protein FtsI/penicillin-binding protein 2